MSRGKMPLESNGVGINSRRLPAESVVSAFQHITYTTQMDIGGLKLFSQFRCLLYQVGLCSTEH